MYSEKNSKTLHDHEPIADSNPYTNWSNCQNSDHKAFAIPFLLVCAYKQVPEQ